MECSRILAHCLKDKWDDDLPDLQRRRDPENWSGFIKKACSEALEAIQVPDEELMYLKSRNRRGPGQGWVDHSRVPDPCALASSGPSISSGSWGGKGKGGGQLRHGPGRRNN